MLGPALSMEALAAIWNFAVHLDQQLPLLVRHYGVWIYGILFVVLFCETGLVVTPFLPGDSLLFVAGALWASSGMSLSLLLIVPFVAVLCGDNCNYWIGRLLGVKIVRLQRSGFLNHSGLERTQTFYQRHGGKTVIAARFIPIVRTFAPFVAGLGRMVYPRFLLFSASGAILWIIVLVIGGYWFGNLPQVREHFTIVTLSIIGISLVPLILTYLRNRRKREAIDEAK
jgi:membrane-associated protein